MTYKRFEVGQVLTADDVQTILNQSLIHVENASERDAIPSPEAGMLVYRRDLSLIEKYNGAAWFLTASRPVLCVQTTGATQPWSTTLTPYLWGGAGAAYDYDTDGMFDPAQRDRFTAPYTGYYRISYGLLSTGILAANTMLDVNGSGVSSGISNASFGQSGAGTAPAAHGVLLLEAGDYVRVLHQSPTTGSGAWSTSCQFSMQFLGSDLRDI